MTITLCASGVCGVQSNTRYPHHHTITTTAELASVAAFDHVAAIYAGDKRGNATFIESDCVVMDIDNDHTNIPSEWITPARLADLMDGVAFMTATSRNHNKPKGQLSARPRFHVYFPISPVQDAGVYAGLKQTLAARFDFFDANATDAGRFTYGNPHAQVEIFNGDTTLDVWLDEADDLDMFAAFDAATQVIGEGSRNATLSRFAGRVLVRFGITDSARDAFDRKAALCEPPLSEWELKRIWASACRFAAKVQSRPDYLPPEAYEQLTSLKPDDFTDLGQATVLAGEYADRMCFSAATNWMAYENGVWEENEAKAQRLVQELTSRRFHHLPWLPPIQSPWNEYAQCS
ncbi:primase alpha helix C-terminal domain-containing protein [Arcanobacterium wilhelmae]|uniref:primase alpha helix C-terminal domain-containing protein n=1 Tax=Arcanobacterium wilhelmae TaxID=1803177 RepID=UPI0024159246|nr:primase alpha helix C-terminal domain-containing protein [Arcanobacterium wilhelmae]WFN90849.1 primase alpha helix C-terminal domain-containing protein [Arcanobacterium wilhelmae]